MFVFSTDAESGHVDLSLLQEDTGKEDIFPESLGLPLRLKGKEKEKYDEKNATRKRKTSESKQVQIFKKKSLKNIRSQCFPQSDHPNEDWLRSRFLPLVL